MSPQGTYLVLTILCPYGASISSVQQQAKTKGGRQQNGKYAKALGGKVKGDRGHQKGHKGGKGGKRHLGKNEGKLPASFACIRSFRYRGLINSLNPSINHGVPSRPEGDFTGRRGG